MIDSSTGKGFKLWWNHFDVHRFYPPLTYGEEVVLKENLMIQKVCLARINKDNTKYYMIITYVYPIVSARAISIIPDFLKATDFGKLDE